MKFKNTILLNIVIILAGIILICFGVLNDKNPHNLSSQRNKSSTIQAQTNHFPTPPHTQTILISVGCSIIASGVISLFITLYFKNESEEIAVLSNWGMRQIEIRAYLNKDINKHLNNMNNGMDIIGLGMRNFLAAQGSLLEDKVRSGKKIRILTISPQSDILSKLDEEERVPLGHHKISIDDLITWATTLQNSLTDTTLLQLKTYDGLPMDTYQRIDDHVFTGPILTGKPSQQTIAYGFKPRSRGAEYFNTFFSDIWNNSTNTTQVL